MPMETRVCVVWNSLRYNYNLSNLRVQSWVGICVPFIITLSDPTPKVDAYRYKEVVHGCFELFMGKMMLPMQ